MACGTGKTLTGLWIREGRKAKRTVVFLPSIALLRQTWQSWIQHAKEEFFTIAVCSDERATSRGRDVLFTSPSAVGIPPTTDPETIAHKLNVRGPVVVFATYQSSPAIPSPPSRRSSMAYMSFAGPAYGGSHDASRVVTRVMNAPRLPVGR